MIMAMRDTVQQLNLTFNIAFIQSSTSACIRLQKMNDRIMIYLTLNHFLAPQAQIVQQLK